ncbi:YbgF trimerization domain-containing protein [Sandarakinorhabdus sp.]|uniref:YbgF trimerization domain-containing protein n=1 Tax=Sandarakinorhabdus sp. TaxID=1916663 RepID=UPI00286E6979|nr:YbgF trimerization domain-containing protein [Sandarakinorhabdus sp.]
MTRLLPALLAAAVLLPAPLAAQAVDVGKLDRRVGTLESEMRAVQRKVFPGGNARYFEPEIPAQAAAPVPAPETPPATTPIADLTGRVDALEGQLKTMTGQIEAMEYKLRQLEDSQRRLKGDAEFRLNALENPGGAAAPVDGSAPVAAPATGSATGLGGTVAAPIKPAAKPTTKPATDGAAWAVAYPKVTARDWPGVETAMSQFVADWPKSTRVPQAKYWLGRSFAARTQYPQAAKAFLDVYQSAPRSTPAPDALIALANALNAMTKPKDACQVLGELETVYGAKLTDTQKADAGRQRTKAKCAA